MEHAETVRLQFCSDMHLELPLEIARFGQHLVECVNQNEITDGTLQCLLCAKAINNEQVAFDCAGCSIRLCSDCMSSARPLESNVLPKAGEYLALLGDVFDGAKTKRGDYADYLKRQCIGYDAVFIVAGNHEFYKVEYEEGRSALRAMCDEVTEHFAGKPKVYFLDQGRVDIPNTNLRVLGCTLWSEVPEEAATAVGGALSDYMYIKVGDAKATVSDTNAWHIRERSWLEAEFDQAQKENRSCIVLTHHAPSLRGTGSPQHEGSRIQSAFGTDLERFLKAPVLVWLFGHTHYSNWQLYDGSKFQSLSTSRPPQNDQPMAESKICRIGSGTILASNQVGYGARGGHVHSRCHPWMAAHIAPDGTSALLACRANPLPVPTVTSGERLIEKTHVGAPEERVNGSANKTSNEALALEDLQDRMIWSDKGLNPRNRELYLPDLKFQELFGMSKTEWQVVPQWKKDAAKKKHGLF